MVVIKPCLRCVHKDICKHEEYFSDVTENLKTARMNMGDQYSLYLRDLHSIESISLKCIHFHPMSRSVTSYER